MYSCVICLENNNNNNKSLKVYELQYIKIVLIFEIFK